MPPLPFTSKFWNPHDLPLDALLPFTAHSLPHLVFWFFTVLSFMLHIVSRVIVLAIYFALCSIFVNEVVFAILHLCGFSEPSAARYFITGAFTSFAWLAVCSKMRYDEPPAAIP